MKNVMTRAWEISKNAVVKFGGKVKMYFAEALKMAWAETKTVVETVEMKKERLVKVLNNWADRFGGSTWTTDWAKGSYDRTYFKYKGKNKSNKVQDYGYICNVTGEYFANASRDIERLT